MFADDNRHGMDSSYRGYTLLEASIQSATFVVQLAKTITVNDIKESYCVLYKYFKNNPHLPRSHKQK